MAITLATHTHDASATSFTPVGNVAASNVQAAIQELDSEKLSSGPLSVTNAHLAAVTAPMLKGRSTSGTGNVEDLTPTTVTGLLNSFSGDTGSGGIKGLVPAPASGDASAGKYLKADGTWQTPSSGSGSTPARQVVIAGSGQGTFNLSISYIPNTNAMAVYQNGVRLYSTDFVETNSTTVELITGATAGDELLFEALVASQGSSQSSETWEVKTVDFTSVSNVRYYCNTTNNVILVTLPISPTTGSIVGVCTGPNASINKVTIIRNGSTIMSLAEELDITINNISIDLLYDGSTWRIV